MRYAFVKELVKQAKKNKNIILLTADIGFSVFEEFAKKFPNQFINVGVAESNMTGLATGLALSGKIVFIYSIAPFVTLRIVEQIRNDICLHNAHVVIIGSGSGLSYSNAGPSHHAIEDLAIIRSLPNITILSPADPIEARWATQTAIKLLKPVYIRMGKRGEPILHNNKQKLKLGKGTVLLTGKDYAIFATGNIVANALEASLKLKKLKLEGTVISMHTIKPIDKNLILKYAQEYRYIFTIEEHTIIGGLGSAVAEILAESNKLKARLKRIGINDTFTHKAGSHAYVRGLHNLTPEKIAQTIHKILK